MNILIFLKSSDIYKNKITVSNIINPGKIKKFSYNICINRNIKLQTNSQYSTPVSAKTNYNNHVHEQLFSRIK